MIESSAGRNRLLIVGLAALAVFPYLQTLGHEFINYDDNLYITENPHVLHGLSWRGIIWAFTAFKSGNWHPVTWLSHMLDTTLWNGWAGGHHLTSVMLHGANTLLLFLLFRHMTGALWRSVLVATLFAIHPLHVESVAWVAERKDVLSTFFGLLALKAYLTYARQPSTRQYLIVAGFFVLSLMAKPMWVTLPFLLLLLDAWPLRRFGTQQAEIADDGSGSSNRGLIIEKIPLLGISVIFGIIAILSQHAAGAMGASAAFPLSVRLANAVVGYCLYLDKLIAPVKLAVFYPYPGHWRLLDVCFSAAILSIVTLIVIVYRQRRPWLIVGWLWFLGALIPVIGLVQIGMQSIADRYTYMPAIGIFVMVAWSIPFPVSPVTRQGIIAATGVWLFVLVILTSIQISYWQNSRTLFAHALEVTRGNFIAHQNLGSVLESDGNLDSALQHYQEAAQENPRYGRIHENVGNLLVKQGRYFEALTELKKAIDLDPNSSTAFNTVGSIALITNRNEDAAANLKRALELDPDNTAAEINYGLVLVKLRRWDEAIAHLGPIVRAEPKRVVARTNFALALAGRGEPHRAVGELKQILQIAPDYLPARDALRKIETGRNDTSQR